MAVAIAIRVRFFARLREVAGKDIEDVKIPGDARVVDVYEAMLRAHPGLPPRDSVRGALNHEFVDWSAKVADGDEVAFIPPVSGGA
ncbi:MAG TPA: molybdopterin converting factor subunit 1 [Candidatus Dormibacteraeota bacterium]|nr:molybdopterin converting factor subunit 1 [Candidatus Dormibacteraeota bacterium]